MSTTPAFWKQLRLIESFEVDMRGRLRPHMLLAYLLNSAWNHAKDSAYGYNELTARAQMWILSKIQLSMDRVPMWGERIDIETWGKRVERFYALRDFVIRTPQGAQLASATSAWMILDSRTYRPQKLDQMREEFPWQPHRSEIDTNLNKVRALEGGEERARFRVSYSDIDVNRHATATTYLRWITDSYPLDAVSEMELRTLEISYLAEATLDEEISVTRESTIGEDLCAIRRVQDSQELCRAVLQWTPAS